MYPKVISIDSKSNPSVLEIVGAMVKNKVGAIIILENGRPLGIITERDVLKKVSAHNRKPEDIDARNIMSSPLITVKAYDSIDTAAQTMSRNKIKRLPVLETDGTIVGIISSTDIAKKLAKILADDYNRYRSLKEVLEL